MDEKDQVDSLYNHALACVDELLEGNEGLAVAAVLATLSLSLYKTLLVEDEYSMMVDKISSSADQIKAFIPVDDEIQVNKKYLN